MLLHVGKPFLFANYGNFKIKMLEIYPNPPKNLAIQNSANLGFFFKISKSSFHHVAWDFSF
jgi:hypothetical protein